MRFPFGKNWRSFLSKVDDARIAEAERAVRQSLDVESLAGVRALDIGSGSGLSSLAMRRLGARVVSFDFDPDSVECTSELRRTFHDNDAEWEVLHGSILDAEFLQSLGSFDLVYAWGVLHHTGSMWRALELAQRAVAPGGTLLIALYNDQGWRSSAWRQAKRIYCSNVIGRTAIGGTFYPLFALYALLLDARSLKLPGEHMRQYRRRRGMSIVHDWRDWLGGYPFEVASPNEVISRLCAFGFLPVAERLTSGWGCNEYVMRRGN